MPMPGTLGPPSGGRIGAVRQPILPAMKTIQDCFGHSVRLTDERMAHSLEHPEMNGLGAEIERVLTAPQTVRRSRSDDTVRLFHEFYAQTMGGESGCACS